MSTGDLKTCPFCKELLVDDKNEFGKIVIINIKSTQSEYCNCYKCDVCNYTQYNTPHTEIFSIRTKYYFKCCGVYSCVRCLFDEIETESIEATTLQPPPRLPLLRTESRPCCCNQKVKVKRW